MGAEGRSAKRPPEAIRLAGSPTRVSGVARLAGGDPSVSRVAVDVEGVEGARVRVRSLGRQGAARVRVRFPRDTEPGTYRGSIQVGDESLPFEAEVVGRARLDIEPRALSLTGAPGGTLNVALQVANRGNEAWNIPEQHDFCFFDWAALEPALGAALGREPAEGRQRLDVLMEKLASSHGGFARAVVSDGAGAIAPGETRALEVAIRLPENLEPGRSYSASWRLHGRRVRIFLETTAAKTRTTRSKKGPR